MTLAICVHAQQPSDCISSACSRATTVDDLASDPVAYLGQVAVIGVVAAVKAGQGFTIVDKREYAACGLSCFNEPGTRKIPVRWDGTPPALQQTIRITGVLEKSDRRLVFSAKKVTEAAKELRKAGWVESSRHAQWKVYRLLPSLAPGLRAVLDGLLSAAKTQTLLLSDLEHMEAILKDPRYSFCCDFAITRRRAKKITTPKRSE